MLFKKWMTKKMKYFKFPRYRHYESLKIKIKTTYKIRKYDLTKIIKADCIFALIFSRP